MNASWRLVAAIALLAAPGFCHAQDADPAGGSAQPPAPQASPSPTPAPQPSPTPNPNATLETILDAGDSPDEPRRQLVHWNEYAGPHFTIRAGGGLLLEAAGFSQDDASKEQF